MLLDQLTAEQAGSKIRSGELSPVELVEALFTKIDRLEGRIQAWTTLNKDSALAAARECEAEIGSGNYRGPLHGIPVGVKDIFLTAGLRTTAGSRSLKDYVPDRDAEVVAKLRRAGAVILGKTVTTEFATFDPGPTRNPWNAQYTPGGSSSGSAAAVAARMCPAALGTQTVGSVGRPASFCGVAGLVPTQGRVSRSGLFPAAWSLDHVGFLARSVRDLALMLEAVSESTISAPTSSGRWRIGVVRDFFYPRSSPETRTLTDATAGLLAKNGAWVEEAKPPAILEMSVSVLMTIFRTEIAAVHRDRYMENTGQYSPKLRHLIETGMLMDAEAYLKALRIRRKYQAAMAQMFADFDALLTPGAPGPAPKGIESTGDPVLNAPWTLADFPTLTLPAALSTSGLPLGLQLTVPPMAEGLLLGIGAWCEKTIDFRLQPELS